MNRSALLWGVGTLLVIGCRQIADYDELVYARTSGGTRSVRPDSGNGGESGSVGDGSIGPNWDDASDGADVVGNPGDASRDGAPIDGATDEVPDGQAPSDAATPEAALAPEANEAGHASGTLNCLMFGHPGCPSGQMCLARWDSVANENIVSCMPMGSRPGVGKPCGSQSSWSDGTVCSFSYPLAGYAWASGVDLGHSWCI